MSNGGRMVEEDTLNSGIAIITGGTDNMGRSLVTLPVSSIPLLDTADQSKLVDLIHYYYSLLGPMDQVRRLAVVADLRTASQAGISTLIYALQAVQQSGRDAIAVLYAIKPKSSNKSKHLKKLLRLRGKKPTAARTCLKAALFKGPAELYSQIDPKMLTEDYGGFLSYHHQAWLRYQKDVVELIVRCQDLVARVPAARDQVLLLQEYEITGQSSTDIQKLAQQLSENYHGIMKNLNLETTIDKIRQTLCELDREENESVLSLVSAALILESKTKLRKLHGQLIGARQEIVAIWQEVSAQTTRSIQSQSCREQADALCKEIEEEYSREMERHPSVGKTLREAELCQANFEATLYNSAKSILTKAIAILVNIRKLPPDKAASTGQESFLSEFTRTIQLFSEKLDSLYRCYVDVRRFHLIYEQCRNWYQRVLNFLPPTLENLLAQANKEPTLKISAPKNWCHAVRKFLMDSPGPKAEHMDILTQLAPVTLDDFLLRRSKHLFARISLLQNILKQNSFNAKELAHVLCWKKMLLGGNDEIVERDIRPEKPEALLRKPGDRLSSGEPQESELPSCLSVADSDAAGYGQSSIDSGGVDDFLVPLSLDCADEYGNQESSKACRVYGKMGTHEKQDVSDREKVGIGQHEEKLGLSEVASLVNRQPKSGRDEEAVAVGRTAEVRAPGSEAASQRPGQAAELLNNKQMLSETVISHIRHVTASDMPSREKITMVESLLTMLQIQTEQSRRVEAEAAVASAAAAHHPRHRDALAGMSAAAAGGVSENRFLDAGYAAMYLDARNYGVSRLRQKRMARSMLDWHEDSLDDSDPQNLSFSGSDLSEPIHARSHPPSPLSLSPRSSDYVQHWIGCRGDERPPSHERIYVEEDLSSNVSFTDPSWRPKQEEQGRIGEEWLELCRIGEEWLELCRIGEEWLEPGSRCEDLVLEREQISQQRVELSLKRTEQLLQEQEEMMKEEQIFDGASEVSTDSGRSFGTDDISNESEIQGIHENPDTSVASDRTVSASSDHGYVSTQETFPSGPEQGLQGSISALQKGTRAHIRGAWESKKDDGYRGEISN